jgi:hypothetical protein
MLTRIGCVDYLISTTGFIALGAFAMGGAPEIGQDDHTSLRSAHFGIGYEYVMFLSVSL